MSLVSLGARLLDGLDEIEERGEVLFEAVCMDGLEALFAEEILFVQLFGDFVELCKPEETLSVTECSLNEGIL